MKEGNILSRTINKLFNELNMSWLTVILFAVGTAVLTTVFLVVPVFRGTSFENMGVTFEAWILFAVIIMANCKKPLESAVKTFVFFLISQPLIYLLQVPFSSRGWELFRYYEYWFKWTLLTFPMAFVGWYITKKNWLSLLIFAPVFAFLGVTAYGSAVECMENFPHLLVTALFCLLQIVLYVIAFFPDFKQKIVGILVPVITVLVISLALPRIDMTATVYLPDLPSLSEDAALAFSSDSDISVTFQDPEAGSLQVRAYEYGTSTLTIYDGDTTLRYLLEVYNDNGSVRTKITALE